jgi:hypothetical protein
MDLKKRLELGQPKTQARQIVEYVNGSPTKFKLLVEVYLNGPYRITQRAALPLTYCAECWPYLLDPHFKSLINRLAKPGEHDATKRNTLRMLQFVNIPRGLQGKVADICFNYLQDRKTPIAIRVFSMSVLAKIAAENQGMVNEIKLMISDQIPYGSPAFKSRAKKVLRELQGHRR